MYTPTVIASAAPPTLTQRKTVQAASRNFFPAIQQARCALAYRNDEARHAFEHGVDIVRYRQDGLLARTCPRQLIDCRIAPRIHAAPLSRGRYPENKRSNQETKKIGVNRQYREEQQRKEIKPWTKTAGDIAREVVAAVPPSNLRIVTDFRFFVKRPLRKLANLHKGVLGNFQAVFSGLS